VTTTYRLAVAGCGTVGGALLDLLARHGAEIAQRDGVRFEVTRVLVRDARRPRSVGVAPQLLTDCVDAFLDAPADIVVEALGGLAPAERIARHTLVRGRRLVTANKALLRVTGPDLADLARRHRAAGAALDFEAAVGGGVPVVRLLRESLAGHGLHAIRGVLNGTTNFILSRIERGADYANALATARREGFAEADPTRDLSGLDAADKIAVLAWLGFGVDPGTLDIRLSGLPDDLDAAVRRASAAGRVLRIVASATRVGAGVYARVAPRLLNPDDPLARVRDEENVIQLESESSGLISVSGRGAGGSATASAVLADLLRSPTSHLPSIT
jgi:homoserine dehydrogenase